MSTIRNLANYTFSTDYEALFSLAKTQSIICDVKYDSEYPSVRDVCSTRYDTAGGSVFVNSRGVGYIWADDLGSFVKQCKALDLKWIVPMGDIRMNPQVNGGMDPLPCPFCGSADIGVHPPTLDKSQLGTDPDKVPGRFYSVVQCHGCGAEVCGPDHDHDCSKALSVWNRRTPT